MILLEFSLRRARALLTACSIALALAACNETTLLTDVPQTDANEISAVLSRSGIAHSLEPGATPATRTLKVDQDQLPLAAQILAQVGLPRPSTQPLSELLPADSWMISDEQEDARLAFGIGQDLAATLLQVAGINEARVHIALAQRNAIGQLEQPASASVLVRYDPSLLDPEFRFEITALVANGVQGLDYDRVAVSMVPDTGGALFGGQSASLAMAQRSSPETAAPAFLQHIGPGVAIAILALMLILLHFARETWVRRR